jgi:hypothetical protein
MGDAVDAMDHLAEKRVNWAYRVSYLRAKFDLPVLLVAVCLKNS